MSIILQNKEGESYRFGLDIDAVIEYEASHPEWSIMDDFDGMQGKLRLSVLDRLCRFIGYPYKDFVALGFGVEDLGKIYEDALTQDLGFPMAESSSEDSTEASV